MRAKDYYPLAAGETWVYKAKMLGREETHTVILGPERDGYFHDDSGGSLAYDGVGLRDERRYLLKEPLRQGEKWTSVTGVGAAEQYEIISAYAPCSVPAGKFEDCIVVRSSIPAEAGKTLQNEMTFARKVGLVRVTTSILEPAGAGIPAKPQVELELVEFRR